MYKVIKCMKIKKKNIYKYSLSQYGKKYCMCEKKPAYFLTKMDIM